MKMEKAPRGLFFGDYPLLDRAPKRRLGSRGQAGFASLLGLLVIIGVSLIFYRPTYEHMGINIQGKARMVVDPLQIFVNDAPEYHARDFFSFVDSSNFGLCGMRFTCWHDKRETEGVTSAVVWNFWQFTRGHNIDFDSFNLRGASSRIDKFNAYEPGVRVFDSRIWPSLKMKFIDTQIGSFHSLIMPQSFFSNINLFFGYIAGDFRIPNKSDGNDNKQQPIMPVEEVKAVQERIRIDLIFGAIFVIGIIAWIAFILIEWHDMNKRQKTKNSEISGYDQ